MRTGRVLKQGQEALYPAVDSAAIDDEASLGEPLDDISITQPIPDVPADGQGNDVVGEIMI